MVSGPDHYCEAERILGEIAARQRSGNPLGFSEAMSCAQVHATLALAAATAINNAEGGSPLRDWRAWVAAAGTPGEQSGERSHG